MTARKKDFIDRALRTEQEARNIRLRSRGSDQDVSGNAFGVESSIGVNATVGHAWVPGSQTIKGSSNVRVSYLEAAMEIDFAAMRTAAIGSGSQGLWYTETSRLWTVNARAHLTGSISLKALNLLNGNTIQLPMGLLGGPSGVTAMSSPIGGHVDRVDDGFGESGASYFALFNFLMSKADYPLLTDLQALGTEGVYFQGMFVHNA